MKMKNLNPYTGLYQITTGHLYLSRRIILEWIRSKKLTPSQLGQFIILLISADWDVNPYRRGAVRYTDSQLSRLWNISPVSFSRWRGELTKKGFLKNINGCGKLLVFDLFTSSGSKQFNERLTDDELDKLFPNIVGKTSEMKEQPPKMKESEATDGQCFRDSFRGSFKEELRNNSREVIIRQARRTKKEYEKFYRENPNDLTPDEMEWCDVNIFEVRVKKDLLENYD